ncbi:DNA polymerase III subunit delta' [Zwartia sp.]|uniref:DNA polymerase III subunit delta' n=1 Tax=Zwartia sp. TaxID=2978004 RepID=UPI00271C7B80|nr:DNA polymerase III subunit delta' [Zwartia sp.]MDO9023931.1 DNA polymerase III subunit delta' [Zwartia sp.]
MQPLFLPWHVDVAKAWLGTRERFAHAWLIHGLTGIGKREFAFAAAASLLCESPAEGLACGKCLACGWVAKGNHPDFKRIRPETLALEEGQDAAEEDDANTEEPAAREAGSSSKRAPSKDIRVEQVRALEPWFNNATHRGGWRVALIYPAEALTTISGNTLLKVLEEPPPSTVFLLVADAPDRLLPTLLSRCRRLPLSTPKPDIAREWLVNAGVKNAEDWLAAAGGAPLLAKKQSESQSTPCPGWIAELLTTLEHTQLPDLGALADTLAKSSTTSWLDALQRLSIDLNLCSHQLPCRYYPALQKSLIMIGERGDPVHFAQLSSWLNEQKRVAGHPLNAKLFAQAVLQRLLQSCVPK